MMNFVSKLTGKLNKSSPTVDTSSKETTQEPNSIRELLDQIQQTMNNENLPKLSLEKLTEAQNNAMKWMKENPMEMLKPEMVNKKKEEILGSVQSILEEYK